MMLIIIVAVLCVVGISLLVWDYFYSIDIVETFTYEPLSELLTVTYKSRKGKLKEVRQYIGSTTVWYTYPSYKRCSTFKEAELSSLWAKWKYQYRV